MRNRRWTSLLLPAPLRHYWTAAASTPADLTAWEFRLVPDRDASTVRALLTFDDMWTPRPDDLEPPAGAILLATPPSLALAGAIPEVVWLRASFPWLSLVVSLPNPSDHTRRDAVATVMAQSGAVVLGRDGLSRAEMARAIRAAFVPELALPIWFGQALPAWPAAGRSAALTRLFEVLRVVELRRRGAGGEPSRRPLWVLAGRAFGAALVLQRASNGTPLDEIASRAGYHDERSMGRALQRHFGLRARQLRGTAGWEWLLWRFLSGLGEGSCGSWDQ